LCDGQKVSKSTSLWLEADGKELTQRRELATNEVINVTRRHCTPEVFQAFYAAYHTAGAHVATLAVTSQDEIAAELRLET
jgi:hypothetical protein